MLGVLTYLFYLLSKPNTPHKTDLRCKGTAFFSNNKIKYYFCSIFVLNTSSQMNTLD